MFVHFIKDKQTSDFLFKGQEDSYAYFKNSLTEIEVLKCSVEIGITYINQKASQIDKTNIMEISISVQCSFFEDHLPRDFLSQFKLSESDSNTIGQMFIWYVFDNFPLRKA